MDASDIEQHLYRLLKTHLAGELTRGQLLRTLRKDVLKLNQLKYCKLAGIGRNALVDLERDQGEPTETIVNKAFAPFGLKPVMMRPDLSFVRHCLQSGEGVESA